MPIEEAVREFARWLEERKADYERRLRLTHTMDGRARRKTEAAELHVILAKFDEMIGKYVPHGDEVAERPV